MPLQIQKFQGEPTYIVGAVLQKGEMVLNGGQGPIFYSSEVLAESVESWDGRPVYLLHAEPKNGVSTISPANANSQQLGTIYATSFDRQSRELTAQLYLNIRLVKSKEKELARRLEAEEPIDVSTGLIVERVVDREAGVYRAVSVRAEHLAVICCAEGLKGACAYPECGIN